MNFLASTAVTEGLRDIVKYDIVISKAGQRYQVSFIRYHIILYNIYYITSDIIYNISNIVYQILDIMYRVSNSGS